MPDKQPHPSVENFRKSLARVEAARVESLRDKDDVVTEMVSKPRVDSMVDDAVQIPAIKSNSPSHKPAIEPKIDPITVPISLPLPVSTAKYRTSQSTSPNISPRTKPRYDLDRRHETSERRVSSSPRSERSRRSHPPQVYHNCRGCTFAFELRHDLDANDRRCPDCTALDEEMATTYLWRWEDESSMCPFGALNENGIGAACGG